MIITVTSIAFPSALHSISLAAVIISSSRNSSTNISPVLCLLAVAVCVWFCWSFFVMYLWAWRQIPHNTSLYSCTSLSFVKRALGYVFFVIPHHVPSGSVAAYNVGTFHAIFVDVCFSDTKLNAPLPNNLGKVTSSAGSIGLAKCVSRTAYFVVPLYGNVVGIKFYFNS